MKIIIKTILCFSIVAIFVACSKDVAKQPVSTICGTINAKWIANVKPIVDAKCASSGCHINGGAPGNFTTYAGLKNYCVNGMVFDRVFVKKDMPPAGNLTSAEMDAIKCWLEAGALEN